MKVREERKRERAWVCERKISSLSWVV